MTSKHERLQHLSTLFQVPPLIALTEEALARLWINHTSMRAFVGARLQQIHATAAAFLDEHLTEIHALLKPVWAADADARLEQALQQIGLYSAEPVAVRSSGSTEDSQRHSFAGMFLTRLEVVGVADIKRAVEEVWASSFSRSVILERVRIGDLREPFSMAVIVQRMVRATCAGVAFSHDPISGAPVCTIEAVIGLGESLVSGEATGLLARVSNGVLETETQHLPGQMLLEVAALTEGVQAALGAGPVDIEWAFDGQQLWLLQARPITTLKRDVAAHQPVLELAPLYASTDAEIEPFKPLPDFAQYFRTKRKPLADFASRMGLSSAASLLVRANAAGAAADSDRLLDSLQEPQVVLDMSERVRQHTLPRERLAHQLQELLGATPVVFVIRDFIQGTAGLISQPASEPGGVLCEWSTDGLLAINRGIASTASFLLNEAGHVHAGSQAAPFARHHLDVLHRATTQAQVDFGQVQLEWVFHDQRLYLIDFSPLNCLGTTDEVKGARAISPGYASGHAVVVNGTRDLEQLSIAACVSLSDIPKPEAVGGPIAQIYASIRAHGTPPIIVAPRPYAALAPLVPFAAGFIFEKAATLCHLAILLREHGVPAVESQGLYDEAIRSAGKRLIVNTGVPRPVPMDA